MVCKDIKIDNIMEVCRLCLGTDNLISVFDDRIKIPENMIDVIQITSGVTVTADDNVSHKLCNKCLHITIKMFKFRSSSIVNDMELKAVAAGKMNTFMNKSVDNIVKKYPSIKLPSSITKYNMSPVVMINKNETTSWLDEYKRKRKIEKRRRKQMKAAKKLLESKKIMMDIDLEKKITPHFISNKEMLPETQTLNSSEAVLPSLQLLTPQVSPVIPDTIVEVDEHHLQSYPEITVPNLETENSPKLIKVDDTYKRKLSPSLNSPKSKKLKLDADPVVEDPVDSLVTLKYVNKSLLICDICNGILYSAKDLKKHKMNHMRCSLCRKGFRSMEETKEHSENGCSIKQVMDNLPIINLKRCDESEEIRKQYPLAFGIKPNEIRETEKLYPVLPTKSPTDNEETVRDILNVEEAIKSILPNPESKSDDVPIEILLISDDEDEEDQSAVNEGNSASKQNVDRSINNTESNKIESSRNEKSKQISNKNLSKNVNTKKFDNKIVKSTSADSTIRPNIEIVGENVLDVNLEDDDISLLKNLLKRTKHNFKDTSIQTDMPCNADISPSVNKDKLFELKNLRDFLNFYKIPVNVSYASQYSVRYGNDPSPLLKKDRSWSKVNTKVPHPTTNNILHSTKTNNLHSTNNIPRPTTNPTEKSITSAVPTSNISTPVSIPCPMNTPAILPQLLVANGQKGVISSVVTSMVPTSFVNTQASLAKNVTLSSKRTCIPSTSNSVVEKTYSRPSTLISSNSPVVLNYNLQNMNYSNNMSNASVLAQTFSNHVPQQKFTIVNNNNLNTMFRVVSPTTGSYNMGQSVSKKITPLSFNSLESSGRVDGMPTIPIINNMPPPSSTFIPHRTSVLKPNTNTIPISALPQSKSDSHNSMSLSNLTCNESSSFVPMIRVRNVAELR